MNTSVFTRLALLYDSFYCGFSRYTPLSLVLVSLWLISLPGLCDVISVFILRIGYLNELSPILVSISRIVMSYS